ncbi:ATP synthase subunit I [Methylotenera sp.]|uniref:ATP synthase subunit I n=1 Tax=Methylotenera sp. TaxID=2051956 RepID=UPI0027376986|nr:ATP synthase subunit I [Methylotenera sp.]MDP3309182.1 ATP synthase subunit I [Methylotenera sp.]
MSTSNTSDVFSKMLKIQLVATFVVATVALLISGLDAGISAVLGGLSVVLGACAAVLIAKRGEKNTDASAILINLLKAEAVKILVIIVLLVIIFNLYKQLVPFALIAGLAAAALFSGAALSKLKV